MGDGTPSALPAAMNRSIASIFALLTLSSTASAQECPVDLGNLSPLADVAQAATVSAATADPCAKTGYPKRTVVPGENYVTAVNALLDGATKSIDILQFNFFTDQSGPIQDLMNRLIAMKAAHPEMRIRVAAESVKDGSDPHGVAGRNAATLAKLQAAGIEVYPVHGVDGTNGVSHAKAIVVDGTKVLAGSTNWSNTSTTKNNEMNILSESPAFGCAFTSWFEQVITDPGHAHPLEVNDGHVTMITDTTYLQHALDVINGAKTTLDFSMYWFSYRSDKDVEAKAIFDALAAAVKRGVKIRGFLERNDGSFSPGVYAANKIVAQKLLDAGVELYFDPAKKISHTKMIVADGSTVLSGSTNWAQGDLDDCHQVNWLIHDKKVAAEMDAWLSDKMANEGTPAQDVLGGGVATN